jgi:hypothetical protein
MTLGPNCPVGNGPVLIAIEKQIEYVMAMLSKMQKERILYGKLSLVFCVDISFENVH